MVKVMADKSSSQLLASAYNMILKAEKQNCCVLVCMCVRERERQTDFVRLYVYLQVL